MSGAQYENKARLNELCGDVRRMMCGDGTVVRVGARTGLRLVVTYKYVSMIANRVGGMQVALSVREFDPPEAFLRLGCDCQRENPMNVAKFLEKGHYQFERVPHAPVYSAQHLAHELHVSGRKVAKTVLLRANGEYEFVVAVLPASKQIDFKRASKLLRGAKLELATEFDISAHCPDCEFGVLPPFGSRYGMTTIVDSSLAEDEFIWFEGNTHEEAIRIKFEDFRRLEQPIIAPFAC